jgi:hypothetical protein
MNSCTPYGSFVTKARQLRFIWYEGGGLTAPLPMLTHC